MDPLPIESVLWLVWLFSACMFHLGLMMGAPCSPCCGGDSCLCGNTGQAAGGATQVPAGRWCCGANAPQEITVRLSFPQPTAQMWPADVAELDWLSVAGSRNYWCYKIIKKYDSAFRFNWQSRTTSRVDCSARAGDYVLSFVRSQKSGTEWECYYAFQSAALDTGYPSCLLPGIRIVARPLPVDPLTPSAGWVFDIGAEFYAPGRQHIEVFRSVSTGGGGGLSWGYIPKDFQLHCAFNVQFSSSQIEQQNATVGPCRLTGLSASQEFVPQSVCCDVSGCGEEFQAPHYPGALCDGATYPNDAQTAVLPNGNPSWRVRCVGTLEVL